MPRRYTHFRTPTEIKNRIDNHPSHLLSTRYFLGTFYGLFPEAELFMKETKGGALATRGLGFKALTAQAYRDPFHPDADKFVSRFLAKLHEEKMDDGVNKLSTGKFIWKHFSLARAFNIVKPFVVGIEYLKFKLGAAIDDNFTPKTATNIKGTLQALLFVTIEGPLLIVDKLLDLGLDSISQGVKAIHNARTGKNKENDKPEMISAQANARKNSIDPEKKEEKDQTHEQKSNVSPILMTPPMEQSIESKVHPQDKPSIQVNSVDISNSNNGKGTSFIQTVLNTDNVVQSNTKKLEQDITPPSTAKPIPGVFKKFIDGNATDAFKKTILNPAGINLPDEKKPEPSEPTKVRTFKL